MFVCASYRAPSDSVKTLETFQSVCTNVPISSWFIFRTGFPLFIENVVGRPAAYAPRHGSSVGSAGLGARHNKLEYVKVPRKLFSERVRSILYVPCRPVF